MPNNDRRGQEFGDKRYNERQTNKRRRRRRLLAKAAREANYKNVGKTDEPA